MKKKTLAKIASTVLALGLTTSVSHAGYFVPGETMGTSLDSPLPEGVFAVDLEEYGRADKQPNVNVGVNIRPRLVDAMDVLRQPPGNPGCRALRASRWPPRDQSRCRDLRTRPILGHDFGGGLTGGVSAFRAYAHAKPRPPRLSDGRTRTEGDSAKACSTRPRAAGRSCRTAASRPPSTATRCRSVRMTSCRRFHGSETFDKLTVGFTGYGTIDLENRQFVVPVTASVARAKSKSVAFSATISAASWCAASSSARS